MTEYTAEQIKENRRKWVEALRSGKYKQGRNWLRNEADEFCCLGVLSKLAGCKFRRGDGGWTAETEDQFAPVKAMAFVGLRKNDGDTDEASLASLNDDGIPFDQIAALIESEPEGLFIPDERLRNTNTV